MFNHNYHFNLNKALFDSMSKIYIYQAFLTFAKSMIGIFVPVYLFKIGYSVIDIILYSIGTSIVYLIIIPFATSIIKKIGFKNTILLSTPIYIIHLTCLNYLNYSNLFYYFSWISFGIYVGLFWPAMHSEIAANSSKKHRGSQLGTLQIIVTLVGTIAPLIGGIFLQNSTYWYLLIFASIIIFLGTIPLLLSKDINIKINEFKFSDYLRLIRNKSLNHSKIAFASEGVDSILNIIIWPIFVFILLSKNFIKLGLLLTIVSFISIFFILYFKKYVDGKNKIKYFNLIIKFLSLNWFLRTIVIFLGSMFLYFVETTSKLIINVFNMSFMALFYSNAEKIGYLDYIILRELYLHGIKIFVSIFIFIPFLLINGENLISYSALIFFGVFFTLGLTYLEKD